MTVVASGRKRATVNDMMVVGSDLGELNFYLNFPRVHNAALSSATQHAMPREIVG